VNSTTTLHDRGLGSPEHAASGSLGGRFALPLRPLRDPRVWARLRQAADVFGVLSAALVVLLIGPTANAPAGLAAVTFASSSLLYSRLSLRKQLTVGLLDSCVRAIASCAVGATVAIAVGAVAGSATPDVIGLRLWLMTAAVLCGARTALSLVERRARARGLLMTPTLVVGAGAVGTWVVRRLEQQPSLGLCPIGFLDADSSPDSIDPDSELPVLGTPADAVEVAHRTGARQLVFAFSWERDHRLAAVVRRCQAAGLKVAVVPRLYEAINDRATLGHVGGLPLMSFRPRRSQGWRFRTKYAIDRVAALAALIVFSPLMVAIAIAVRFSSPGPLIYRQRRVGRNGREFDLLKFRSMTTGAGRNAYIPADGAAPGGIEGADRRTCVGRWLRNTSLDELPQFLNVLRGEMSLVGPRPERPEFAAQFADEVPGYDDRHRIKPGITGWAQVNGLRGQTSIADRVEWDNHYIENWSVGLELRTLALTVAAVSTFREPAQPAPAVTLQPVAAIVEPPAPEPTPEPDPPRSREPHPWPALRLVDPQVPEVQTHWFCGYCATSAVGGTPPPMSRVCTQCGAGLLLEAPSDVAPGADEPFLVVDGRLTVQAVSRRAEEMLGVKETEVTDHPITELITDADVELNDQASFVTALTSAAQSDEDRWSTFVRPREAFGIRIRARISHCGPPRAALLVLETPGPDSRPRLRLVPAERPQAAQQRL
jgi:exopolysaccharide biosynthesis polyprenyl glycosylphosphotransferase